MDLTRFDGDLTRPKLRAEAFDEIEKAAEGRPRRERRVFTEEFKRQAVQLLHERRADGVSVTQIGRELDVKPVQLREWAQELATCEGGRPAAGAITTPRQELKRLRREVDCSARWKRPQRTRGVLLAGVPF